MKPGDVVVGVLAGAIETKVRPAMAIASSTYLVERLDVDWQLAGSRAESYFRACVLTAHRSEAAVIGHLSDRDWNQVRTCVRAAFAI